MKQIEYKGKKYPIHFNMLVFDSWQRETGKKLGWIAAISARAQRLIEAEKAGETLPETEDTSLEDAITMLKLVYFGILDACEEKEVDFDVTIRQFIRSIPIGDIGNFTKFINLEMPEEEETENNGLPIAETIA